MRRVLLSSFQGRIGRSAFVCNSAASLLASAMFWLVIGTLPRSNFTGFLILLSVVLAVWISLALQVKRSHDMNMSGWHVLWIWGLVTAIEKLESPANAASLFFFFGVLVVLSSVPGSLDPNRFGDRRQAMFTLASAKGFGPMDK